MYRVRDEVVRVFVGVEVSFDLGTVIFILPSNWTPIAGAVWSLPPLNYILLPELVVTICCLRSGETSKDQSEQLNEGYCTFHVGSQST